MVEVQYRFALVEQDVYVLDFDKSDGVYCVYMSPVETDLRMMASDALSFCSSGHSSYRDAYLSVLKHINAREGVLLNFDLLTAPDDAFIPPAEVIAFLTGATVH